MRLSVSSFLMLNFVYWKAPPTPKFFDTNRSMCGST